MLIVRYFPSDEYHKRKRCQRYRVEVGNIKQRSLHHYCAPVVNTTSLAAFIVHKPLLKRTEKDYADKVAQIEKHLYYDYYLPAVSAENLMFGIGVYHIQNKNNQIERTVYRGCLYRAFLIKLLCKSDNFRIISGTVYKTACKLFSTAFGHKFKINQMR